MFFKRLMKKLFGMEESFIPDTWPDDDWDRMFLMAEVLSHTKLPPIGIESFDEMIEVYSDTIVELFIRLDMLLYCIASTSTSKPAWKARRRDSKSISIADYYYDNKTGYIEPQEVLEAILKKLSAIHYQMELKQLDDEHVYTPYMKREFRCIVSDVLEIFNVCLKLRIVPQSTS